MIRAFKAILKKWRFFLINHLYAGTKRFKRKNRLLRKLGVKIGSNTKVVGPIYISCSLTIGNDCWIGKNASFEGNGSVVIEDCCDIGPNVVFNTGGHSVGFPRRAGKGKTTNITVGTGTWVCERATILNDVHIGNRCVVGACSLVISSAEDDSLIVGVPGKIKKKYEKAE